MWAVARANIAPWRRPCVTTSWIRAGKAWMRSWKFGPTGSTDTALNCSMTTERARTRKPYQLIRCGATQNKKIWKWQCLTSELHLRLTRCGFSRGRLPIGYGECHLHNGEARPLPLRLPVLRTESLPGHVQGPHNHLFPWTLLHRHGSSLKNKVLGRRRRAGKVSLQGYKATELTPLFFLCFYCRGRARPMEPNSSRC